MDSVLRCWKCSASLESVLLPISRLEACPSCSTDLHVCRQCRFFAPRLANACAEPVADAVADKVRANFCGYFEPANAAVAEVREQEQADAVQALGELFGVESGTSPQKKPGAELNALFGLDDDATKT